MGDAGIREATADLGGGVPEAYVEEFQAGCVHRRELLPEWFFRACVAASRRTPLHVWRRAMDGLLAEDQAAALGTIAHPTLLLGGRQDAVFAVSEQEELARALGRPLTLYRHCGHTPHWEEPGRFAENLADFWTRPVESLAADRAGRPLQER